MSVQIHLIVECAHLVFASALAASVWLYLEPEQHAWV